MIILPSQVKVPALPGCWGASQLGLPWSHLRLSLLSHFDPPVDFPGAASLPLWTMSYCSACALLTLTVFGPLVSFYTSLILTTCLPSFGLGYLGNKKELLGGCRVYFVCGGGGGALVRGKFSS